MLKATPLIVECQYVFLIAICVSHSFLIIFSLILFFSSIQQFLILWHTFMKPKNVSKAQYCLLNQMQTLVLIYKAFFLGSPICLLVHYSQTGCQVGLLTTSPMPCSYLSLVVLLPNQILCILESSAWVPPLWSFSLIMTSFCPEHLGFKHSFFNFKSGIFFYGIPVLITVIWEVGSQSLTSSICF